MAKLYTVIVAVTVEGDAEEDAASRAVSVMDRAGMEAEVREIILWQE